MNEIRVEITAWYFGGKKAREKQFEYYHVHWEAEVQTRWGGYKNFKDLNEMARTVLDEAKSHNMGYPKYNIILKEGNLPNGTESHTEKPPEKIAKELTDLLRNGTSRAAEA